MFRPSLEEIQSRRNEGNLVPIYREIVADLETPVSAFLKVSRGRRSFLLESVEGGQWLARYSFIGTDPYLVISSSGRAGSDPLTPIAEELGKYKIIPVDDLPRFCGGAVGYLSYETAARFEDLPTPKLDPIGLPESMFMFVDTLLVFDHVTHRIKVCSHVRLNGNIEKSYQEAVNRIDALVDKLHQPLEPHCRAAEPQVDSNTKLSANFTRKDFEDSVLKLKEYISAGEVIQVVISQRLSKLTHVAPLDIYRALRTISPSPYMFFLDFRDFCIVGASPEILLRVESGTVITRPLAGTRPRGKNPEEDSQLEQELLNDDKERAEHIMLVDLGRNDIGRVSEPGSVEVSELMNIEKYSHVMHLVTNVQGRLRKDLTPFDALRACFPAGTVSGAPKIRAMQIIAEIEREKRGVYAGAVGYFSFTGNMDMAIAIRTIVMKDNIAYVQTGCGVVHDSVPQREYEETQNKARGMLKAIEQAESSAQSQV